MLPCILIPSVQMDGQMVQCIWQYNAVVPCEKNIADIEFGQTRQLAGRRGLEKQHFSSGASEAPLEKSAIRWWHSQRLAFGSCNLLARAGHCFAKVTERFKCAL